MLAPDKVSVVEAESIVTAPAPEITPESVWFVDDACRKVPDEPMLMAPEYVPLRNDAAPLRVIPPAAPIVVTPV